MSQVVGWNQLKNMKKQSDVRKKIEDNLRRATFNPTSADVWRVAGVMAVIVLTVVWSLS